MHMRHTFRLVQSRPTITMLHKVNYTIGPSEQTIVEKCDTAYEEALQALNAMQSNAESIRQSIQNKKNQASLDDTYKYLARSGLSLERLDELSVIHVTGTKGKGSTCALTESILRSYGVQTGFFSSPHLISVTERIRINGEAISKKKFTHFFWKVFEKLHDQKECSTDMPSYFKFLTIMSLHVFLEEKVNVAILEVGIGGEYDCTNIVRNTSTVGISSLGLEHTNILGDKIEDIAWQKAGIIKPNSKTYTSVKQLSCLRVLEKRAAEKNTNLIQVPEFSEYFWPQNISISNFNKIVQLNGSLAIQLAYSWLAESNYKSLSSSLQTKCSQDVKLDISKEVIKGLTHCVWLGRCQVMDIKNLRIHLDGAHTSDSIVICSDWFASVTKERRSLKVLIFNTTGDRNSKALLEIISSKCQFDIAFFVPNIPFARGVVADNYSMFGNSEQLSRAQLHESMWKDLIRNENASEPKTLVFKNVLEALCYLSKMYKTESIDVLVTGSIHLIGATIIALEEFSKS